MHNHDHDPGGGHGHAHDHDHSGGHGHAHDHDHSGGHGHAHRHVHSAEEKKAVLNRLSRAIGHLESVKRMVERDEDCSDVLIQLAAVRNAINNTGKVIMKNHISHCIVEAIEQDDLEAVEALNDAIDHFIK
ncbi:MAG: metal-sensing transcriptional repressor [Lachnospiraceae bacterium]|nr:metal-sensing transcriptional repressor [Lachnospiraceae bacterium]